MLNTLENLIKLARERKKNPIEGSYTNKLLLDKSLSKSKVLSNKVRPATPIIEMGRVSENGLRWVPSPAARIMAFI